MPKCKIKNVSAVQSDGVKVTKTCHPSAEKHLTWSSYQTGWYEFCKAAVPHCFSSQIQPCWIPSSPQRAAICLQCDRGALWKHTCGSKVGHDFGLRALENYGWSVYLVMCTMVTRNTNDCWHLSYEGTQPHQTDGQPTKNLVMNE